MAVPTRALKADLGDFGDNTLPWDAQVEDVEQEDASLLPVEQSAPSARPAARQEANPFDAFEADDAPIEATRAPSVSVFDQFDDDEPAPDAPERPTPFVNEAFRVLWEDKLGHQASKKDAADESLGRSFLEGIVDPQQYGEFGKGIAPGAIRFGGTAAKGTASIQHSSALASREDYIKQLNLLESVDRGEEIPADAGFDIEIMAYQRMTPEQRADYKKNLQAQAAEDITPLQERTLFETGEALTKYAKELFPAAKEYDQAVGRQLGEGIGSLLAGLPAGFLGRVPALAFFGTAGSGEAVERALAYDQADRKAGGKGLTEQQIITAALWGIGPGATDLLPVEVLLGRLKIPQPFRGPIARSIGRIGGQAFVEGLQEGGQEFLQNLISQQIYNDKQELGQGVLPGAGIGAGVGGIAEVGRQLIARFGGRRSGGQQQELTPEEEIRAVAEAIDQGQQVNRAAKGDQLDVAQQPAEVAEATTQEAAVKIPVQDELNLYFNDLREIDDLSPESKAVLERLTPEERQAIFNAKSRAAGAYGSGDELGANDLLGDEDLATFSAEPSAEEQAAINRLAELAAVAEPVTPAPQYQRRSARPQEAPGKSAVQFLRERGGIQPSGELDALDADRYPGLVSSRGLTPDQAREALVEGGYLTEADPEAEAVTTPNDVFDLLDRELRGERVVPVAEQQIERQRIAEEEAYQNERELQAAEQNFILPEIQAMDEEIGTATFSDAYAKLSNDEKAELIERSSRQGEDVADLLEEFAIRNEDVAGVAAMAVRRGLTDEQIAQVRQLIQQNAPDLATGFDELVSLLPKRGARSSRGAASAPQLSGEQAARIADLGTRLTSVESQQALGKALDDLSKSVSASDWKALGQNMTGRTYRSGKAARDAVMQQVSDRLLLDERVQQVKDLFGRQEAAEAAAQPVDQQVSDAYWRLTQRPQDWVSLQNLRAALPGVPRAELDAALKRMYLGKAINLAIQDDQGSLTQADRDASMQMGASRIDMLSMRSPLQDSKEADPVVAAAQRRQFADILNSRVPRSKWAEQLGVTDAEMQPLIEEAIEKGFLRRDRNGVIRRVPKSQRPGSFAGMVIPNDLPDSLPGDGNVAFTPEAADQKTEMTRAVNRAAMKILPEAVSIDVVDNIKIAKLRKEDELLALREDAAFRNWFGDSKVVDENGEPLVVYHGTRRDFEEFLETVQRENDGGYYGRGFYFSESPGEAEYFATLQSEEGSNIVPTYLSIKNPFEINDGGEVASIVPRFFDQIREMEGIPPVIQRAIEEWDAAAATVNVEQVSLWDEKKFQQTGDGDVVAYKDADSTVARFFNTEEQARNSLTYKKLPEFPMGIDALIVKNDPSAFRDFLRANGYDGVHMGDEWVAFEPTQIKSIFNRGTFDPTDPRISYALRTGGQQTEVEHDKLSEELDRLIERLDEEGRLGLTSVEDLIETSYRLPGDVSRAAEMDARLVEIDKLQDGLTDDQMAQYEALSAEADQLRSQQDEIFDLWGVGSLAQLKARPKKFELAVNRATAIQSRLDELTLMDDPAQIESRLQEITSEIVRLQRLAIPKAEDKANLEALRQERKQLIAQWEELPLEARAAKDQMLALRAFHASPYEFDKFDLSRIGTGEGAQAFGHGLYYAEAEGTGKAYFDQFLRSRGMAHLYEVEIDVEPDQLLDWDKPLSEQSESVKAALRSAGIEPVPYREPRWLVEDLWRKSGVGMGPEAASSALREAGIPGIRYLDQGSRGTGDGTRNIVIFDDSLVKITKKNGKPVTGEERQGVVDQMLALRSGDTGPRTPTEVKVYHGTGAGDIQRFDPAQSVSDGAIFFTPSTEAASRYAGRFGDLAVYPVYIETENFKTVDFEGRAFMDEEGVDAGTNPLDGEIALAKEEGYSGLIVQNIEDIGGTQDQYVTWTEGTVRSSLSGEQMFAMRRQARQPEALGRTDPYNMVISLAMKAVEAEARSKGVSTEQEAIRVLRHEAIEFFNSIGMFTPKEWQLLQRTGRKQGWVESTGVRQAYEAVYKDGMTDAEMSDLLVKEAIAEQYSEFHLNRKQFKGKTAELFQRIKDFISRVANFMRGEGFQTWDDVFTRIDEGEFKQRFNEAFPELAPQQQVATEPLADMAAQALPGNMPNPAMAPPPPGPTPGLAPSAPGSLIDIQRRLRKRLGLPVKRGRLSPEMKRLASQMGGMLRGQYSRQTGVIRLAILEDIDSEAHEVGHALESRYDLEPVKARHHNALMGIARMSGRDSVSEGFAEFFRLYLTNPPAAEAHAPDFFNEFEEVMSGQDPQALAAIQDIRDQYQDWRNASSAGRITAAIKSGVKESTFQEIRNEYKEGGIAAVSGMYWRYLERVYQGRIDRTNPIRKLMMRIARQAEKNNQDIDLTTWRNPQMQAQKIVSSDAAAYIDLTQAVHWENSAGKGTVSLRDALLHAYGGTEFNNWSEAQRANFAAYMIARRGRWIWRRYEMDPAQNRGRGPNPPNNPSEGDWYFDTMRRQRRIFLGNRWETELMRAPDKHNRADHVQTVADLEAANPQFAQAAQMVYQFLRDLALKRYQAGLDSREEYEYKTGTPDYVPWFRDMSDEIFAGTAVAGRKVAAKFAIKGSYRDFIDPIEGIARQVYDTNQEIAVNKPKLLLAKMAEEVQNAGQYAEIIPATRMKVEEVRIRDALQSAAIAEGLPPEDAREMISTVATMIGEDAVAKLFKSEQAGEGRDAILHYMDNGVLKMLQIHDDGHGIAKDILGFFEMTRGTPFGDSFFDMMTAAVRAPQRAITSTPGFLWRNLVRDTFNAAVLQGGYFPIVSNVRTVASNFVRKRRGEETWAQVLARHGGIMGGLNRTNIQQLRQGRVSELRTEGVVLNPARRDFWARTVNPFHEDFWKWAEWSEANARQTLARISFNRAFQDAQSRYPTMPVEQQSFIALEAAVHRSRDYTDYGRTGDFPSQTVFNRLVMFLNPALQGPDKMVRALLLAQTNEGKFAAAQVVRKKLAPLFDDRARTKPLTKSEKDALKDAMRAWVTVGMIAVAHLMIELMLNDEEELRDKKELERALNVTMTINGQPYRIPRGFDIVNVASNALRAQYDSWRHEDPTAWQRFRKTLGYSLVPPHSSPLLDMYIGWKHGRNNFFGSDIEPEYMQGRLPEDRYKAYTSGLSKDMAEGINAVAPFEVSPLMVEYTMSTIGSDWARDIMRAYDAFDPDKPALRWQEYPFIRTTRGLRGSRGSEDYWQLMGRDGAFIQPAGSYKEEAVKAKDWTQEDLRKFFERRVTDDDARAYAILNGHYDTDQRRLHPMERAKEFIRALSATGRQVGFNRIDDPRTGERYEVSRAVRQQANEIMAEISRREYLNALIAVQRPGYEFREPMPVKPYLEELERVSPDIHNALMDKIKIQRGTKVYDYETVRQNWPEVRRQLLDKNKREDIIESLAQVEYRDLNQWVGEARALGIR